MQRTLLLKAAGVFLLFIVILIPLHMIGNLVAERGARQTAVAQEIAASSYGRQTFGGLMLTIPYTEEYTEVITENKIRRSEARRVAHNLHLFPLSTTTDGQADVQTKRRSLFKVRVFQWQAKVSGEFGGHGENALERDHPDSRIVWGKPFLSVGISDTRGLMGVPQVQWDGQTVRLERDSGLPGGPSGLHAPLPALDPTKPFKIAFSLDIGLQGTQSLSIVPLADSNHITLRSDWANPSFSGAFLPTPGSAHPASGGFDAQWNITSLASSAQRQVLANLNKSEACRAFACADHVAIGFIEPIDVYSLSDRATKYGFLFITITFGCLFLFELLKATPVHAAQYGLAGMALATFFLLLLALSEHLPFALAYTLAAVACIAQLGAFLGAALKSRGRGFAFAGLLTSMYAALYGLLISEDNALMLGALLVFVLISVVMVATRKLDWYAIGTGGRAG